MPLQKIISGGQTGADRAALDFAIYHAVPHGGWCPKGHLAEDGPIGSRYQLQETSTKNYPQRTERNVKKSDGTVIFTVAPNLTGGSRKTAKLATKHRKPWLHLHRGIYEPAKALSDFIAKERIETMNVAGSRGSKEPEVYVFVKQTLEGALYPRCDNWLGGPGEG